MPNPQTWLDGSATQIITTGLNSLADAARAISLAFDATGYMYADFELKVEYTTSAPAAGTKMGELYMVSSVDGTNYCEGSTSLTPQRLQLVGAFESRNGATGTFEFLHVLGVALPARPAKWLFLNTSGKTLAASGNILTIRPFTPQA